jgi:hypothetical protein
MTDKRGFPIAILVMAIAGWLGAAISVYRIYTQSQIPNGDLIDAILNTGIFTTIAVFATFQYRKANKDRMNR